VCLVQEDQTALSLTVVFSDGLKHPGFYVNDAVGVCGLWRWHGPRQKNLRDTLIGLVDSYEKTHGEIKPLKLPPGVPAPKPSTGDAGDKNADCDLFLPVPHSIQHVHTL